MRCNMHSIIHCELVSFFLTPHPSKPMIPTSSSPIIPTSKTPTSCRREFKGCGNMVNVYTDINTAVCPTCELYVQNQLEAKPPPPKICPCCRQVITGGPTYSFCDNCWAVLERDAQIISTCGFWVLDRAKGEIVCIDWRKQIS